MCLEFPRRFIARHKTVWCPSKTIEDGVFLRFFFVVFSRRKAVLLRGGLRRKGLGGIITYKFHSLSPPLPCTLEHSPSILYVSVWTTVAELAVVLLPGAEVPQVLTVVPQEPTVVPLLRSRSTVAPWPSTAASR